jgi:hypothetical protein
LRKASSERHVFNGCPPQADKEFLIKVSAVKNITKGILREKVRFSLKGTCSGVKEGDDSDRAVSARERQKGKRSFPYGERASLPSEISRKISLNRYRFTIQVLQ